MRAMRREVRHVRSMDFMVMDFGGRVINLDRLVLERLLDAVRILESVEHGTSLYISSQSSDYQTTFKTEALGQ